jgi:hypothetical protein
MAMQKKAWMTCIFIQGVFIFLQEIYSRWSFSHQSTLANSKWAW